MKTTDEKIFFGFVLTHEQETLTRKATLQPPGWDKNANPKNFQNTVSLIPHPPASNNKQHLTFSHNLPHILRGTFLTQKETNTENLKPRL